MGLRFRILIAVMLQFFYFIFHSLHWFIIGQQPCQKSYEWTIKLYNWVYKNN
jgi:hypothetical protein